MQFKHPEILYALFLLLIPIIIHLFQLRKFEKVVFTNVQFLKKIELKTRKSSRLKKILVLMSRLLLFTALIFSFAQPYLSNTSKNEKQNTYVYLDNSLSMQVKGQQGEMFKRAIQDLIDATDNSSRTTLYTNNKKWINLNAQDLKNTLLSLEYYPIEKPFNAVMLEVNNNLNKQKNISNTVFLISDFQHFKNNENVVLLDSFASYSFIQLAPTKKTNISIDSIYISKRNNENITLKVIVKNYNSSIIKAPISLYDKNILLGKSTVDIQENSSQEVEFKIPFDKTINGRVNTIDDNLTFDNNFYFTINQADKINILAIGEKTSFLENIYTKDEHNYKTSKLNNLDYNSLSDQNLIVLNELETIPSSLINSLSDAIKNGSNLVVIPNVNSDINSYNSLFSTFNIGTIGSKNETEVQITDINFSHPFYENVFEKSIKNFQYPKVNNYYVTSLKNSSTLVSYENRTPFISQVRKESSTIYWVSGAINTTNSNFKNSPLIVPIFYNFGKFSYNMTQPNYIIGRNNSIEIKASLRKDDILEVFNDQTSFIPIQQVGNTSVKITMNDTPLKDGIYSIKNKESIVKNIAFNYDRNESDLSYHDMKTSIPKSLSVSHFDSVKEAFKISNETRNKNILWQFFLGASLFFLVVEVLLLKFFKP